MSIDIEYGAASVPFEVTAGSTVITQESYAEPPRVDAIAATERALTEPLGIGPLRSLVGPGSRVAIAFPDRVKGGTHAASHRRVALRAILEQLHQAKVPDDHIRLICAIGLHRKNSREQMSEFLPHEVLSRYGAQLDNHDAEDPDGIVDLGRSALGDAVGFNRFCAEADLTIVLGHVQGNPYGGFSGGSKTFTTGLTTWRSIAGHHVPASMHRPDFVPISPRSHFRRQLQSIAARIEESLDRRLFVVDAVIGQGAQVLGVFAGVVDEVERASWPLAEARTNVQLDTDPFDVVVFGLPADFHYGPGMGRNPILVGQAIAATLARVSGAMRPGCVAIVAAQCDGFFNDDWFPSYRETFQRWTEYCSVADMSAVAEEISTRSEYVEAYRAGGAYHPFHAFSMLSMAEIGLHLTSRIFLAGAGTPGYARAMGMQPVASLEDGLREARKYIGAAPRILVLPGFLTSIPPHLFARA